MSSSTSASTPVSGHATTENETLTLADEVKKYNTAELISYLKSQDLGLIKDDFDIIENERISGRTFLKTTKEELRSYGMKGGPATDLADFAKECKEKKKRAFSSYHSLKEVIAKYGLDSDGIELIPLFEPQAHEIQDSDKYFKHCMADILFKLKNYGSLVVNSLESMRNEYVATILHTALHIARDATDKDFSMRPEYEIIGEDSSGRVDYAIKEAEDLICVTEDKVQRKILEGFAQNIKQLESSYETNKKKRKRGGDDDFDYLYGIVTSARDWHFLLYTPGVITQASELPYTIEFNKKALEERSEERETLYKAVKKVLSVVVGLLKDRATCSDEEPDRKRAKIDSYRSKK